MSVAIDGDMQLEANLSIKEANLSITSSPNALNNRVRRETASALSSPFCFLFNQSLHTGILLISYKEANVCLAPKTGDLSMVSNYRLIPLLNPEAKLFEKLIPGPVFKNLFNHFRDKNLLSSLQSGFIPGDSKVNQLTYPYNIFCETLDGGKEVRAVFGEISKAFDHVWHAGLLYKLEAAGVTGEVIA